MYRIDALLKQNRKLFHTSDLALIWGISNKNTLYTTIKRHAKRGVLLPIHKGFYATVPLEKIEPMELGISFLHQYAYLSTESVLAEAGIISQEIPYITLVSGASKKFTLARHSFVVRQMHERFLYQSTGVNGQKASPERAVADLLYFNPHYYFDGERLIDWKKVKLIQKEVGFK